VSNEMKGTVMEYVTVVPAYGRDYKSAKEVREGYAAGHDFLVQSFGRGGYVNKDDHPAGVTLQVRYRRLERVVLIGKGKGFECRYCGGDTTECRRAAELNAPCGA